MAMIGWLACMPMSLNSSWKYALSLLIEPTNIWYNTTAMAYTSSLRSASSLLCCSGGIYPSVPAPLIVNEWLFFTFDCIVAWSAMILPNPKSLILGTRFTDIKILAGFMSLCTIFKSCAATIPLHMPMNIGIISVSNSSGLPKLFM